MGMYTYVRGWISIHDEIDKFNFDLLMAGAKGLSERSDQCVFSTVFNTGFNFENYIFIGGGIKNYHDDWNIFFKFLRDNFDIIEYNIESRYEEDKNWSKVEL